METQKGYGIDKKDSNLAYKRALYRGCGFTTEELSHPIIGIVNSYNEVNPGHIHLHQLAEAVKVGGMASWWNPYGIQYYRHLRWDRK